MPEPRNVSFCIKGVFEDVIKGLETGMILSFGGSLMPF